MEMKHHARTGADALQGVVEHARPARRAAQGARQSLARVDLTAARDRVGMEERRPLSGRQLREFRLLFVHACA
jgi:hypothetical protein